MIAPCSESRTRVFGSCAVTTYRDLRPFPMIDAVKALSGGIPKALIVTMSIGQWDGLLSAAYALDFIGAGRRRTAGARLSKGGVSGGALTGGPDGNLQ